MAYWDFVRLLCYVRFVQHSRHSPICFTLAGPSEGTTLGLTFSVELRAFNLTSSIQSDPDPQVDLGISTPGFTVTLCTHFLLEKAREAMYHQLQVVCRLRQFQEKKTCSMERRAGVPWNRSTFTIMAGSPLVFQTKKLCFSAKHGELLIDMDPPLVCKYVWTLLRSCSMWPCPMFEESDIHARTQPRNQWAVFRCYTGPACFKHLLTTPRLHILHIPSFRHLTRQNSKELLLAAAQDRKGCAIHIGQSGNIRFIKK